jgi:hypothetical protein
MFLPVPLLALHTAAKCRDFQDFDFSNEGFDVTFGHYLVIFVFFSWHAVVILCIFD